MKASELLYDLSGLSEMVSGDKNEIKELNNMFLDTTPQGMADINESYQEKDYVRLSSSAHKLKSTIGLWGIKDIKTEIELIEKFAKEQSNLEKLPALIEKLNKVLEIVLKQLEIEVK